MSSKKWPKKRSSGIAIRCGIAIVLCFLPGTASAGLFANPVATDKVVELQIHFDREPLASSKIKILEKLGQAQFATATSDQHAGNFNDIGFICEKFRDNVRTAFDLLKTQQPNAEKHAEGYRHLELLTRRGIREVEDLLLIVPSEVRPPLELVRGDLIQTDDELIHLLFPRHTREVPIAPPPTGKKP